MYKGLLGRESLRDEDGVKCFRDSLRTPLQRSSERVPLKSLSIHPSKKSNHRDGQVGWQFSLVSRRLRDAWMDVLPLSTMSEERKQNPVSR